jgi:phosphatidylserine decarboxylase
MVRDAYRFFIPLLSVGLILAALGHWYGALPFGVLAAFVCFFFRNPPRLIPEGERLIVSPADGKVVRIAQTAGGGRTISIFLSIFNVHVNRSPVSGQLDKLEYVRGKFKPAFDDEASRVNEQNILTISTRGYQVVVRQIAGLIARRVVCFKKDHDPVERGELIGLIRFGSRVDVTLPDKARILVKVGDRVKGGSSILGDCE